MLTTNEFMSICKKNKLYNNKTGFKKPKNLDKSINLKNEYSWMNIDETKIIYHIYTVEFTYTFERLNEFDIYDFELCWFLKINLKNIYNEIIELIILAIEYISKPNEEKKKYLFEKNLKKCTSGKRKNQWKPCLALSLIIKLPYSELTQIEEFETSQLTKEYHTKDNILLLKLYFKKILFKLESMEMIFQYNNNNKLNIIRKYLNLKKYEIYNKNLKEIKNGNYKYSSFFYIYLKQMNIKINIPKNMYFNQINTEIL